MVLNILKIIAVVGLLILSLGVLTKKEKKRNILFALGGILLITYSIFYLKDAIIMAVQTIFTLAALYNLINKKIKRFFFLKNKRKNGI